MPCICSSSQICNYDIVDLVPERMVLGESDMFARRPHPSSHLNHPADLTGDDRPHSPVVDDMLPREPNVIPNNVNPAGGKIITDDYSVLLS